MNIYTIGYTRKSAREFFELLQSTDARYLLDVRLRNDSHLAGFTKKGHVEYFTEQLTHLTYAEVPLLAPSEAMFKRYRSGGGDWPAYEESYIRLMEDRRVAQLVDRALFAEGAVLLCGEPAPDRCHRRLAAEFLKRGLFPDARIVHL